MKPKILTVGHACLDIVHTVQLIPKSNTKVASDRVQIQVGGNAANAAVALCDLGASADLCTVLGRDSHPFTRILLALLKERCVGVNYCRFDEVQDCPNSTIMVLPNGERAIVNWQADEIRSAVSAPASLDPYQMVIADAYRLPMIRQIFALARSKGVPTMLDVDGVLPDIGLLPSADHIWFSQEAWRCQRISLSDLQARFGGIVGVTDGDRPVTWIDRDGKIRYHQPPQVIAKNTLGAGDVFRARLALGLCLNESVKDAINAACITAGEHIIEQPLTRTIQ